jgi:hypothetical protein
MTTNKYNTKSIVGCLILSCASLITNADNNPSCSTPLGIMCWKADALYYAETRKIYVGDCQTKTYILNTVVGSICYPASKGYIMFSSTEANWVSIDIVDARWVGNTKQGFCVRTHTIVDGYAVNCSSCRVYNGPDGKSGANTCD